MNSRTVSFNATVPTITQPLCFSVGVAGTATFAVGNAQLGSTYTWSFDAGFGTIIPPNGNPTVTVSTTGTAGGPYNCSVTNTTPNCGFVNFPFTVTVTNPYTATATVVPAGPCAGSLYSVVSVNTIYAGSTYQLWDCTTNAAAGSGTTSYQLNNGTAGSFTIIVTIPAAQGGCTYMPPCVATCQNLPVAPPRTPDTDGGIDGLPNDHLVELQPNPNSGTFTLNVLAPFKKGSATIVDAQGKEAVGAITLQSGANELGSERLKPGTYTVRIDLDGDVRTKNIIVTK